MLTPPQLQFVDALLAGMTVGKAARYVRVNERTGRRWWRDAEVQAEFDDRRKVSRDLATARLQTCSLDAVETLYGLLTSPDEAIKARAADHILKHQWRGTELSDLIGELKGLLEEHARRCGTHGGGEKDGGGAARAGPGPA